MIIARTSLSLLVATTLYVAAILFLKAAEPGLRTDSGYKRKLKKIEAFGANPTNRYPLDRCQGDCDVDAHCKNGLVCFQRKGHEAVPGCSGGTSDSSRSDYCIDPSDVDGGQPNHNEAEPPKENKDNPPLNFLGVNPAKKDFPLQGTAPILFSEQDTIQYYSIILKIVLLSKLDHLCRHTLFGQSAKEIATKTAIVPQG
mmetsp:Transcript_15497/g.25118  ORF Transcript_15497/g.25118 Transcript_15497/m.25118 type:complete len:199 (+) Transcript_15497:77-673(+)